MSSAENFTQSAKPNDLDLHCLLRQGMTCSASEWLTSCYLSKQCRPDLMPHSVVSDLDVPVQVLQRSMTGTLSINLNLGPKMSLCLNIR